MYTKSLTEYVFNDEFKKIIINGYVILDDIYKEIVKENLEVDASYYKKVTDDWDKIEDEIKEEVLLEPTNYKTIIIQIITKYLNFLIM